MLIKIRYLNCTVAFMISFVFFSNLATQAQDMLVPQPQLSSVSNCNFELAMLIAVHKTVSIQQEVQTADL